MVQERVPTGIMGLDELVRGGLPRGKTYLVSGEAGTGKTVFCLQYALHGLSLGENCVYLTVDEKPAHLVQDAAAFGWDLRTPIDAGRLCLMDLTQEFSELRLGRLKGGVEHEKVVGEIRSLVKKVGAKRLVMDPIVPMFARPQSWLQLRECVRRLMFSLDDLGTTNLVSSFIMTGSNMMSRFGVEEFFASGVIILKLERGARGYNRVLVIRKMRGTPIEFPVRRFDIDANAGIVVSPA